MFTYVPKNNKWMYHWKLIYIRSESAQFIFQFQIHQSCRTMIFTNSVRTFWKNMYQVKLLCWKTNMIGKYMCFLKLLFQILFTKKIIELIIKIQLNRYQTFKEYVFFNHGFRKRLYYEDFFLVIMTLILLMDIQNGDTCQIMFY